MEREWTTNLLETLVAEMLAQAEAGCKAEEKTRIVRDGMLFLSLALRHGGTMVDLGEPSSLRLRLLAISASAARQVRSAA